MSVSKVFITGASGYVGGAIALRLARSGRAVHGLTRDPDHARALAAIGVTPVLGDVAEPESYLGILKNCDAVVHALVDRADAAARDQQALEAYRTAARDGRVRRLLYTSGAWVYGDTGSEIADETRPLAPHPFVAWLAAHEEIALDLGNDEVHTVVFRPAVVYGEARGSFGRWFAEARDRRTVTHPGDGAQRWGVVHRDDVASAYLLALEHGASGEIYNLSDENHFTVRELAEAVARATGAMARERSAEEVRAKLGAYGEALLGGILVTAAKARRELGWAPRHLSFVNEVDDLLREWQAASETPATS